MNLRLTSKSLLAVSAGHAPDHLSLVKLALGAPGSMRIFEVYGARLRSLSLQRVTTAADALAVAKVLALTPFLRKLSISDLDWSYSDEDTAAAIGALGSLTELRLQCADALSADRLPFAAIVRSSLGQLPTLRKLTLFSRLDGGSMLALLAYLGDRASRRLYKLKVSTGLLASPGGAELIEAVAVHGTISKLTIVRPDGIGEPLRKGHCSLLGLALVRNKHLMALHLRRCGLWTDSLSALVPPAVAPHVQRLKLDGNSLGYLAGAFFNEAADALLSRLPNLTSLHLGNNQLSGAQVEGLASTFSRYKLNKIENLTVGSNDIGDEGIRHLVKALPPSIRQLYLHGIDASDKGVAHICAMLPSWPSLWGLGLNGNPVTVRGGGGGGGGGGGARRRRQRRTLVEGGLCTAHRALSLSRALPARSPHARLSAGRGRQDARQGAARQPEPARHRHHPLGDVGRRRRQARGRARDGAQPALRVPLLVWLQGGPRGFCCDAARSPAAARAARAAPLPPPPPRPPASSTRRRRRASPTPASRCCARTCRNTPPPR